MPAAPDVELCPATWADDRPALQSVRRSVFIEEQGIPAADEWDDIDPVARHVIVVTKNRDAVGTGRLEPTGKIGRVAVLPQYRGTGVGNLIMGHLVNQATELGFTRVYLHAQTAAAGFYARLGFRAEGPVFDECGIPHLRMTLGITGKDGIEAGRRGHEEHPLLQRGRDGVVAHKSAHVDYIESELVVRGEHSCQNLPATIEEIRRILHRHLTHLDSEPDGIRDERDKPQ